MDNKTFIKEFKEWKLLPENKFKSMFEFTIERLAQKGNIQTYTWEEMYGIDCWKTSLRGNMKHEEQENII